MATLWEVGDGALCTWKRPCNDELEVGKVYNVVGVCAPCGTDMVGLMLAELPIDRCGCGGDHPGSWLADRFKRIKPDKKEANTICEQLLKLAGKTPVRETEDA
jgi:hypothetical protein